MQKMVRSGIILIFFLLLALQIPSIGQTAGLRIKPVTTEYKRTADYISEERRILSVRKPVLSGGVNKAALRKIATEISYWKVFNVSFKEAMEGGWLQAFDFAVKYNKNNILSLALTAETMGAYPDTQMRYVSFDTRSGHRLEIKDLVYSRRITKLRNKVRKMMDEDLRSHPDGKVYYEMQREIYGAMYHPSPIDLQLDDLEGFSISSSGMHFYFDYGFPHSVKAAQPPGDFYITWAELKPFIKPRGLLARFAN